MLDFSTGGRNRRIFYHILIEQGSEIKRGIEERVFYKVCVLPKMSKNRFRRRNWRVFSQIAIESD
jgi:hypothetical protein